MAGESSGQERAVYQRQRGASADLNYRGPCRRAARARRSSARNDAATRTQSRADRQARRGPLRLLGSANRPPGAGRRGERGPTAFRAVYRERCVPAGGREPTYRNVIGRDAEIDARLRARDQRTRCRGAEVEYHMSADRSSRRGRSAIARSVNQPG